MKDLYEGKVRECLVNFDFIRVKNVMDHLNWQWAFSQSESAVPSVREIVILAKDNLEEAYRRVQDGGHEDYIICTGGVETKAFRNNNEEIQLSLRFILEETQTV